MLSETNINNRPISCAVMPSPALPPLAHETSTVEQVANRHHVSVAFIRKEIERGQLRAICFAPGSHRRKVRIRYADELAWLESCLIKSAKN